ncbi:MAG TPA: Vms1/Ankzf1 family peptidyl-tRNA hydrolase [Baekduia sp.]|uniref:baeRF10 domain-containing protein n=1 Tax=Baekduia sp. TaxID=2600305 RepID=UPI002BD25F30|nr:Vms1/Ankzf1 family peptidyl-tRNA hydrolase [Baekduia sp.]HMJ35956.1 Vms1/Ankzf1 family peptidyl-tRNA hydrolase [Baekduia sp.]
MATDITTDRLRELAETRTAQGKVLSVFINLDPREFATPPARATEISSVMDEAGRAIRDHGTLTHAERTALEHDVERVRAQLRNGLDTEGARGLAVFASELAGLFEILKLPRPVPHKVAISDHPCVEPLARIGAGELWWLVLVDRRRVRLLAGTIDGLVEVWRQDDDVPGKHDQGGLSQARYQRSVEKEVDDHLRAVNAELQRRIKANRVAGILLGGPKETVAHLEQMLHADVAKCLKGRFDVDVWNSSTDEVLNAARAVLDELTARRDRELQQRIDEGLGTGGRAAAGLNEVLTAVHERRVDTLVVQDGFTAKGTRCPQCGWLGVSAGGQCPADGTMTEAVDDVVEIAVARAFAQDARVRYRPATDLWLEQKGSIAALLRF